ncbi:precorrin-3B C(17)-methyltransferase [Burkholderia sp. 22PA0099]|uniref:precorrin-3B C(17)-methyltransferase n=1 Tax=Burkholderia sp. 22PA0099 TaxID=3237372 RepID=UPI0039C28897
MNAAPAIVVLGAGALPVAERIRARYAGATIHALAGRVDGDVAFTELGAHLRALYARGNPIVALCAAGIVIRCVAACLTDKGVEPPVLAVAEDGSAVVPLLGGLTGVNLLAREIADVLGIAPAITTSGELRFGACVLNPPEGYALADIGAGKRFVSDLLAGAATRIEGDAPWLDGVALPVDPSAAHAVRITPQAGGAASGELVIHPRSVVVAVTGTRESERYDASIPLTADGRDDDPLARRVLDALAAAGLSPLALAVLVAPKRMMRDAALARGAQALGVPLRFVDAEGGESGSANGVADDAEDRYASDVADGAESGSTNGIANGAENGSASGMADSAEDRHASGVADGAENGAANGIADGAEDRPTSGMADGAENAPANGVANCNPDRSANRSTEADARTLLDTALVAASIPASAPSTAHAPDLAIAIADAPVDATRLGQARGKLTVLGLGPGSAELMTPAARAALAGATDILGYATYVRMAGTFRADQRVHETDNREELQRARHAFELAAQGRQVAMVSSGDPGVFAMAAAVLEALDASAGSEAAAWADVALDVVPGVSAAMAAAAQAGAPLGHDFCVISLSDNLKPWGVIEERLALAARADLVMAFYNPVSKARPWQLDRALEIVRAVRTADTVVVLGRDIGRPGATLRSTTLGELRSDQVDMRTMVIVGSSKTRRFTRGEREWIYTPRFYD